MESLLLSLDVMEKQMIKMVIPCYCPQTTAEEVSDILDPQSLDHVAIQLLQIAESLFTVQTR